MNSMQEIGRNVLVMVGSIVISVIVILLVVVGLFFLIRSQLTPDKIMAFLFGG